MTQSKCRARDLPNYAMATRRAAEYADAHAVGSNQYWRDSWATMFQAYKAGWYTCAALKAQKGKRK